ncbi:reverse transcriptase [Gossypium australe]|uniref:Reverse transcriptase n=1 Tax=Gossypium australe TaxID=47621 RepID=A0A5B6VNI3_9ROSI|nr:reverse transcriptase [Gossypium australe]
MEIFKLLRLPRRAIVMCGLIPPDLNSQNIRKFLHNTRHYYWDGPFLFKNCANLIIRRCVPEDKIQSILQQCHSPLHFGGMRTGAKGLDFVIPFPPSWGNLYIFLVVEYVSKWVEVVALPPSDAKSVMKFIHKNIFIRFDTPRTLISNERSYFGCEFIANALHRYWVKHKIGMTYHPQTNGQAEVSNGEIK